MSDAFMEDMRAATALGRHRRSTDDIPTSWTAKHLALRIKEHFTYWDRTPGGAGGPKEFGGNWPGYQHTWQDVSGYRNRDGEPEEIRRIGDPWEEHMRAFNRARIPLNSYEVMVRDRIADFLLEFRRQESSHCDFLVSDGRAAADRISLRERAQSAGMAKSSYDDARKRALNACVAMLNRLGRGVL